MQLQCYAIDEYFNKINLNENVIALGASITFPFKLNDKFLTTVIILFKEF